MELQEKIQTFLNSPAFAVVGASNDKSKFGNKVLRTYMQKKRQVHPVNPNEKNVEGLEAFATVLELPNNVQSLSIVTPPSVTENVVAQAVQKGIKNIWMQPGADSKAAVRICEENDINVISGGPCLLVELGFRPG